MKKSQFALGIILAALFGVFTYLVRTFDVGAIGPGGSEVGFSHLNQYFHDLTGVNLQWYGLTEMLGYTAIAVAGIFALIGLVQWIGRKSLFAVDREIIALGVLFAVVIALYVGFDKFVINYRPILMPGTADVHPEPSYPSSHTMLICVVMGAAIMIIIRRLRRGAVRTILVLLCAVMILMTVGGRLYCGVHWLTDIIGGLILSMSLLLLYASVINGGKPRRSVPADAGVSDAGSAPSDKDYKPKH